MKKSKKDKFYKKVIDSSEIFIQTQLKDLVYGYKNNRSLTDEQKRAIEKIVKDIGIQYQLEIGAFVAACTDKHESYDTLFYQNAVGSTLESIVAEKNELYNDESGRKPFEIRQRKILNKSTYILTENFSGKLMPYIESVDDALVDAINTSNILNFKHLCDRIVAGGTSVTNFEGRKVIAPICVASSRAAATGYNTEQGIKTFVEDLDPRLEELTLVRCDTAHIWTELQVAILTKAACTNEQDFDDYIYELFEKEGGSFVVEEGTGFYKLNTNSEIYRDIYNKTVAAGVDWERKFFHPMIDVFKEHHFKDADDICAGVTKKYNKLEPSEDASLGFEDVEYKSTYDQELEEIEKLRKIYCEKWKPLIGNWLLEVVEPSGALVIEMAKDPLKRLGALSLVINYMDNSIFIDTLNTLVAKYKRIKHLAFRQNLNKQLLENIKEFATKDFVKVLGDNQCIKDELYSLVNQILEDQQPDLPQNPDEEFILPMVYASMYAEEHSKDSDEFRSNFSKINQYCSRDVKQNAAIAMFFKWFTLVCMRKNMAKILMNFDQILLRSINIVVELLNKMLLLLKKMV